AVRPLGVASRPSRALRVVPDASARHRSQEAGKKGSGGVKVQACPLHCQPLSPMQPLESPTNGAPCRTPFTPRGSTPSRVGGVGGASALHPCASLAPCRRSGAERAQRDEAERRPCCTVAPKQEPCSP